MKERTLREWKEMLGDLGATPIAWSGHIKKVWPTKRWERTDAEGKVKSGSFALGVLFDDTGEIDFKINDPAVEITEDLEGAAITIAARPSKKPEDAGKMVGAGIRWNQYTKKDGSPVKRAQIQVTIPDDCLQIAGWNTSESAAPAKDGPAEPRRPTKLSEAQWLETTLRVYERLYTEIGRLTGHESSADIARAMTDTAMISLQRGAWTPDPGGEKSDSTTSSKVPTDADFKREDDDIPF